MLMKRKIIYKIFLSAALLLTAALFADIPEGYYNNTGGLADSELRSALYHIIKGHNVLSYTPGVWNAFQTTDLKPNGKIWDMYSAYEYTFGTDQVGSSGYSSEGDAYNREHSWPQSFFNEASPMKTDLFHIYPTDGYVNGVRSNYPYGETDAPNYTSTNGSKRGYARSGLGYSGIVFEPVDEYKGDFARSYFYMATRYYGEDGSWSDWAMADGVELKPWAVDMLLDWHRSDPVSAKEINRNDAVYDLQNNRNPYIDHPEYAEFIWGEKLPAPEAENATDIDSNAFMANWSSISAASFYELFVSEDETFAGCLEAYGPKTTSLNYERITGLEPETDYYYKVKALDGSKESDFSNTVHVLTESTNTGITDIPGFFVVSDAYPNPFNPECTVTLQLRQAMQVCANLYDSAGNFRKSIFQGPMSAGEQHLKIQAAELPSAVYLLHIQAGNGQNIQKLLLIK
jgi:endonuclease I